MISQSTKDFIWDSPLGSVSFGQVSFAILREMYRRKLQPNIMPMGPVDISTQVPDDGFNRWLQHCIGKAQKDANRNQTALRLWHLNGSLTSYSKTDARLLTFFELDSLTPYEINVLRNQDRVYVTSNYTKDVFKLFGVNAEYVPLGFDSHNFHRLEKRPSIDGVLSMSMFGKCERRKGHHRVLNLWAKRYGNKREYRLNCFLHNPFMQPAEFNAFIGEALEGRQYWNVLFHAWASDNATFNSSLQSGEIVIDMSGGEGRSLPTFHAVGMGAWPVALNAHAFKDYLTPENAILVNPNGKVPAADGKFFGTSGPFNVGNLFTWADEDFYAALEEAEKRAKTGINLAGLDLQKQTYSETLDILLKDLK